MFVLLDFLDQFNSPADLRRRDVGLVQTTQVAFLGALVAERLLLELSKSLLGLGACLTLTLATFVRLLTLGLHLDLGCGANIIVVVRLVGCVLIFIIIDNETS